MGGGAAQQIPHSRPRRTPGPRGLGSPNISPIWQGSSTPRLPPFSVFTAARVCRQHANRRQKRRASAPCFPHPAVSCSPSILQHPPGAAAALTARIPQAARKTVQRVPQVYAKARSFAVSIARFRGGPRTAEPCSGRPSRAAMARPISGCSGAFSAPALYTPPGSCKIASNRSVRPPTSSHPAIPAGSAPATGRPAPRHTACPAGRCRFSPCTGRSPHPAGPQAHRPGAGGQHPAFRLQLVAAVRSPAQGARSPAAGPPAPCRYTPGPS